MRTGAQHWALAVLAVLLLVSLPTPGSAAPTTSNTLAVHVTMTAGGIPPAGLSLTLTAAGTGQTCTSQTTATGGSYVLFSAATGCTLVPGWYTVSAAPQIDTTPATPLAIFPPTTGSPDTFYLSQAALNRGGPESYTGLSQLVLNQTLTGDLNQTNGAPDTNSAMVEVLDPAVPGFVLAQGTFTRSFVLNDVPAGSWTVYADGLLPGANTPSYNYTSIDVAQSHYGVHWQNLSLGNDLVIGNVLPDDHFWYYNQTNVTLWDTATGQTYSFTPSHGTFQQYLSNQFVVGDFNSLTGVGDANRQFLMFVQPQGYSTSWSYLDVNPASVATTPQLNFPVSDLFTTPATTADTTIDYAGNFSAANVTSRVTLTNDSVFTHLPNSNLGDLYSQVAMDFGSPGQVNATVPDWTSFANWLNASGPVYPANQMDLMTNSSSFLENGRYHWSQGPAPANLDFDSADSYWYQTSEQYNLTTVHPLSPVYSSYTINFGYAYPSAGQSLHYTVNLPRNYVLQAGSEVPNGTELQPGPGGNWTSFTLIPLHSPTGSPNGTVSFTVVRIQNVTAVANVLSPNFAFSNTTNVLNQSHDNYQVLLGLNQNASFSSIDSVFPFGFNASTYVWNFGDGSPLAPTYRQNTTAWHSYSKTGEFSASLTLTANGGQVSEQKFKVYVDGTSPSPVITTNNTHVATQTSGNTSWVWLNWSQGLQLNATHSNSTFAPAGGLPVAKLSDAIWNISSGPTYFSQNFSIGAKAASVFGNVTYEFLGAGNNFNHTVDVNDSAGATVYTAAVHGWVYRVVLKLYDAGGNLAYATLWVFVNDTEKPIPIGAVQGGPHFYPGTETDVNETSGVALGNQTCNVQLEQWSYAPHNGTIAAWSWEISNPTASGIPTKWINQTSTYSAPTAIWLVVPQSSGSTATPYVFNLTVRDAQGNRANASYTFTCELRQTTNAILVTTNTTVVQGTTLTDGNSYTLYANVTNEGGNASTANNTVLTWYYETSSGGGQTTISTSNTWYLLTSGVPSGTSSAAPINIPYNKSYRGQVSWTPGSSLAGSYQICANATSTSEFNGSYRTDANVYCLSVTFQQSLLTQYIVYIAVSVVVVVALIVIALVLRSRSKGGSKKGSAAKKGKAKDEDEDEDEAEEERPSKSKLFGGAKGKAKDEDEDKEDDDDE